MNRQSLTWLFFGVFSACGGELVPNESEWIEQQREVTYREGPVFDEAGEQDERILESPPKEDAVGLIPSTGTNGLVLNVLAPSTCTPLSQSRQHEKMRVAVGGVRVHLPGYCINGEFKCESFNIVTDAAHADSRFSQRADVSCFITPEKRMEAVVHFDSLGRPTEGHLRFTDTEANVLLESSALDFGAGKAPFACDEGVTAAFTAFGNATTAGADIGLMIRYTE